MTKQHEKLLLRVVALALAILTGLAIMTHDAHAGTGFLVGEWTEGSSRFCEYDSAGRTIVITVDYQDLCPMQVEI